MYDLWLETSQPAANHGFGGNAEGAPEDAAAEAAYADSLSAFSEVNVSLPPTTTSPTTLAPNFRPCKHNSKASQWQSILALPTPSNLQHQLTNHQLPRSIRRRISSPTSPPTTTLAEEETVGAEEDVVSTLTAVP
jgi:hypothetical protein